MEPWQVAYLEYFGLFIISIAMVYATGFVLFRFLTSFIGIEGFYQRIFFFMALGVFSFVVISSCIVTHFKTISTGFFLIGLILIYESFQFKLRHGKKFKLNSKEIQTTNRQALIRYSGIFLLALFFFSWQAYSILKRGTLPYVVPDVNCVYWADLCESLWSAGQENTYQSGNIVSEKYFGASPYHYFEMWLTAFFSWLLKIKSVFAMHLIVFPLFFLMMVLGAFSILETISIPVYTKRLFVFALLFLGGIPFIKDYYAEGLQWLTIIESPFFCIKTAHHYWIAIIGMLFIMNNFFIAGIVVFFSLIFVSASLLPAIISGSVLFFFLSLIFKIQTKKEITKQAVYFGSVSFFFWLFYLICGNSAYSFRTVNPILYYTDLNPVIEKGFDWFFLKVMLVELMVRIYKIPFEFLYILSPFLLVIIFAGKKLKSLAHLASTVLFIICIYFSALVCFGIFYRMHDSIQFYDNIFFFILLFLFVIILLLYNDNGKPVMSIAIKAYLTALLIFKFSLYFYNKTTYREVFSNVYSDEYISEIINTASDGRRTGVFFKQTPDRSRLSGRNAQLLDRIGGYTSFSPWYPPIDLSIVEMKNWDIGHWGEMEQAIVKTSPFYQFVEEQKKNGSFVSTDQSQVRFIEDFNIGYVIASKGYEISPLIIKKVNKTIVDARSGERFMLLQ